MMGSHVIVDASTLAKGPQDVPVVGPKTLFLTALGWFAHRPSAMQFGRAEDAQTYIDDTRNRHPNVMRNRDVKVINHPIEGEGQPVPRGKVVTDYDPHTPDAA